MTIDAIVIRTDPRGLLVRSLETGEEIMVLLNDPSGFSPGDYIRITFNGQMTHSIPPQITATAIQSFGSPPLPIRPPEPNAGEARVMIVQKRQDSLLVLDMGNLRQLVVRTPYVNHFCIGQQIIVRYDTIIMSTPPEVTATGIASVC